MRVPPDTSEMSLVLVSYIPQMIVVPATVCVTILCGIEPEVSRIKPEGCEGQSSHLHGTTNTRVYMIMYTHSSLTGVSETHAPLASVTALKLEL